MQRVNLTSSQKSGAYKSCISLSRFRRNNELCNAYVQKCRLGVQTSPLHPGNAQGKPTSSDDVVRARAPTRPTPCRVYAGENHDGLNNDAAKRRKTSWTRGDTHFGTSCGYHVSVRTSPSPLHINALPGHARHAPHCTHSQPRSARLLSEVAERKHHRHLEHWSDRGSQRLSRRARCLPASLHTSNDICSGRVGADCCRDRSCCARYAHADHFLGAIATGRDHKCELEATPREALGRALVCRSTSTDEERRA